MTTGVSVRTLASPGFVFALVVLVLNDHVLKAAYPGWITGKLSDVAGLVVAPLLLGVLLTAWRVPRPMPVAIALTGIGFTIVKASIAGATAVSAVWSLTGVPTQMRADLSDLLALPALYGALLIHRESRSTLPFGWRRTVAIATGTAMLPVAVLATAATNCSETDRVMRPALVAGSFNDAPSRFETRAVVEVNWDWRFQVDRNGRVSRLSAVDANRVTRLDPFGSGRTCDNAGRCWRIGDSSERRVDLSLDGGTTWQADLVVSDDEAEDAVRDVQTGCGQEASADLDELVVLGNGDRAIVVVGANSGGIVVRDRDGEWELLTLDELGALPEAPNLPGRPEDSLRPVPAPSPDDVPSPRETPPSLPPEPTCASPTTVSATPNPQNGPPTSNTYCP